MGLAEILRHRRLALGRSDVEVAGAIGLNLSWYLDLERSDDELITNLPFGTVKWLLHKLGLEPAEFFAAYLPGPEKAVRTTKDQPLHELIGERRRERGWSPAALADQFGYEAAAVTHIESEAEAIETYTFEVVLALAVLLSIPIERFFKVQKPSWVL